MYGTLISSGATGTSEINPTTVDDGLVETASGTLDFASRLLGTGALKIDAGATLQADAAAVSTLTTVFNGGDATLALKLPKTFAATIGGFAATDTIDLLAEQATSASINPSDQLVILDKTVTLATLQLTGAYTDATFSFQSDGHGGTDVTLMSGVPETHAFVEAMAGLGGVNASMGELTGWIPAAPATRLLSPTVR